ncbi:class I SAM-dependent methyltransferase [Reichenbachiella sp.]
MNDYDRIAWIYDELARLIFRGNLLKSQTHYLSDLKPNDRILIIGGGTGKVLEALSLLDIPLEIDFIEPSTPMIEKARKRMLDSSNLIVNFQQVTLEAFTPRSKYDCVCCFYFFDLFKEHSLKEHMDRIKTMMTESSNLLVADFNNQKANWWKKALSATMHWFFKMTTQLESNKLKNIDSLLLDSGFRKEKEVHFFSRFIFSAIYQKEVS